MNDYGEGILENVLPELDAINDLYRRAYVEGRRAAFAELLPTVKQLQQQIEKFCTDGEHALESSNKGDTHVTVQTCRNESGLSQDGNVWRSKVR
jgi:hypothetical protein